MPKRRLYEEPLKEACDSADLFYLQSKKLIEPGMVRFITFAMANNITESNKTFIFGKLEGDTFYAMEGTTEVDADAYDWHTDKTHHFKSGEIPCFKCVGSTSGRTIEGYMEGYDIEYSEAVTEGFES